MRTKNVAGPEEERIRRILSKVAEYNQTMYEYGKNVRCYGTSQDLRIDQTHIIDYIGKNPKCKLRDIAVATDNSLPTVSLQIKRLMRLSLVEKRRSEQNQREITLDLTEDGRRVFNFHENLDRKWAECFSERLSGFDEQELDTILRFLEIVSDHELNNI